MGERLLVIDSATAACSVAFFTDGTLADSNHEVIGRGHAEKLVPMIAGLAIAEPVDRILVDCGPGSFTGVRIGVSAAKALGLAWNARVEGYQCLSLVAAMARQELASSDPVCVAMIGGHGEYFVQNFDPEGPAMDEVSSLKPQDAARSAKSNVIAGNAANELAAHIDGAEALNILPSAASVGLLPDAMTSLAARPIYGRKPDAKPANAR